MTCEIMRVPRRGAILPVCGGGCFAGCVAGSWPGGEEAGLCRARVEREDDTPRHQRAMALEAWLLRSPLWAAVVSNLH